MPAPLADKIRPTNLDEMVGQEHLISEGKALRKIIESKEIPNMIFYGPSGVGKTTLASIIAKDTKRTLRKLNGTTATTSDIRGIYKELDTLAAPNGILLYLDEIQYFNKKQQQTLLEFIENGKITLVASTTENPYFYIYNAILSRSTVFEFKNISVEEIKKAVLRALDQLRENRKEDIEICDEAVIYISTVAAGDVRKAINILELCVLSSSLEDNRRIVTPERAKELSDKNAMRYDRKGDEHYDILSAFQKSMRGSDPDAAIHYLARLLEAGDMISAIRRMLVCACEDVGLAYPALITIVKACADIAVQVGMPEARIPLANAVIMICSAPKSNSAYIAIDLAMNDIKSGKAGPIPRCLQNKHFDGADIENKGQFYKYPHDFAGRYVRQQYLPDNLLNMKYYNYAENKTEQAFKTYWEKIKKDEQKK